MAGRQALHGEQTRQGDQSEFEFRLYRKSRSDRDSKLNRDISFVLEAGWA